MLKKITAELEQLGSSGQLRQMHPITGRSHGTVEIRGRRVVDFTSWDLFGLNENPRFKASIQREIDASGLGACSARTAAGNHQHHVSCEYRLAQFLGTESAVLFSSKNQVVLSLVTSMVSEGDTVLMDEALQSPVSDAAFLVNAQVIPFNAMSNAHLRSELAKTKPFGKKFVFVEALSPLTGLAPELRAISDIALGADAALIVDESYSIGSLGLRGAGGCEAAGIAKSVFCIYGSLSHALASYGAFAAGPAAVAGYLVNRSRTFSAEPPLPPAVASATETAIDIVELGPLLREHNRLNAARVRNGLREIGFKKIDGEDSPIVCIPTAKTSQAQEIAEGLFQKGFLLETLSRGQMKSEGALVRAIITPQHSEQNIDALLGAAADVFKKLSFG